MRGKRAPKRKLEVDPIYGSEVVTRLINYVMKDGEKAVARKVVYNALEDLGKRAKSEPVSALNTVLEHIKPTIEVRARRVGGANYQVPVPVREERQVTLAFRWLVDASRNSRGKKEYWRSLSDELFAAFNKEGNVIKKKEDTERMAESNRAFSQFSW